MLRGFHTACSRQGSQPKVQFPASWTKFYCSPSEHGADLVHHADEVAVLLVPALVHDVHEDAAALHHRKAALLVVPCAGCPQICCSIECIMLARSGAC